MIEAYLVVAGVLFGLMLMMTFIAAAVHLEVRSADTAQNVRTMSLMTLLTLVWPITFTVFIGWAIWTMGKGLWSAFTEF